jgi:RNA polymerase sigma-70 factor (ECF subfamily)
VLRDDGGDGPDDAVVRTDEHDAVAAALTRLGTDDRAVLGCRYVAGLSELETAEVLGLPVGTVKSRTARALTRLRSELESGGVAS